MKTLLCSCAGVLLAVNSAILSAAELPDYYPVSFEKIGIINVLPTANNTAILISDRSFVMARDAQVHTLVTRNASLSVLRLGQLIGFSIVGAGPASKGEVMEIWALPSDYKRARKGD